MGGNLVGERKQFGLGHGRAGRVVGIRHKDDAGLRRDGLEHRSQIMTVLFGRNDDRRGIENFRDERIDGKTKLRHHHLRAGREQRVADEFDDLVGAVAENQMGRGDAQFFGEFLFESKSVSVGIKVQAGQDFLHRGQGGGRGSKRIFVGRELDDARGGQAEFAGNIFNRTARLIDRQIFQRRINRVGEGHHRDSKIFGRLTFLAIRSRMMEIFSASFGRVLTVRSWTIEATS